MWIFSQYGFYSIVQKNGTAMVRARIKRDLENLVSVAKLDAKIVETPTADYRFRILLKPAQLPGVFEVLCASVDYPNFKSEIALHADQSAKLPAYHRIWGIMANLQPKGAKGV